MTYEYSGILIPFYPPQLFQTGAIHGFNRCFLQTSLCNTIRVILCSCSVLTYNIGKGMLIHTSQLPGYGFKKRIACEGVSSS